MIRLIFASVCFQMLGKFRDPFDVDISFWMLQIISASEIYASKSETMSKAFNNIITANIPNVSDALREYFFVKKLSHFPARDGKFLCVCL